jgi:hypothetical protein
MAETANGRVVINLTTGHEDADKVTVAFLVGGGAGEGQAGGDVPDKRGGAAGPARLRGGG